MKVEEFRYSGLNNGGHFQFGTDVINRAEATPTITSKFKPQLAAFKQALEAEDAALKLSTKSLLTDQIQEADQRRDKLYPVMVRLIHDYSLIPDKAESAKPLSQAIVDYGIKPRGQRDKQSGLMSNLFHDMRTKYAASVDALGLGELLGELEQANQQVIDLMQQRTEERKNHLNGALKASRNATELAYRDFVETINARIQLEGEAKYADFVAYLNAEILHYQREVLHQKGKPSRADENTPGEGGNNNGGNDGEEEPPQG
ncbi:MAG: DUF6261 family protein [Prevotellaceae bacterium]|jgi:hypothetical protein|nr:DUF6261 family protein [Prevotellaceae bacterium]